MALRSGADARERQSLALSASPTLLPPLPLPSPPVGHGAVDTGRWPHQSSHPTSWFCSLWDVNHKLKFCFPAFFPKEWHIPAWHHAGKGQEASQGVWLQGFGLALLGSHHPLAGHGHLTPHGDTELIVPACHHPSPALSLAPSCSERDLAAANRTGGKARTELVRVDAWPRPASTWALSEPEQLQGSFGGTTYSVPLSDTFTGPGLVGVEASHPCPAVESGGMLCPPLLYADMLLQTKHVAEMFPQELGSPSRLGTNRKVIKAIPKHFSFFNLFFKLLICREH